MFGKRNPVVFSYIRIQIALYMGLLVFGKSNWDFNFVELTIIVKKKIFWDFCLLNELLLLLILS